MYVGTQTNTNPTIRNNTIIIDTETVRSDIGMILLIQKHYGGHVHRAVDMKDITAL